MSPKLVAWVAAKHPGKCKCGADVQPGRQAEYDFAGQSYTACAACAHVTEAGADSVAKVTAALTKADTAATAPAAPAPPPFAPIIPDPPPNNGYPLSPLAILEQAARCFAPRGDVGRIVDAMILAGVRAAWKGDSL